MTEYVVIRTEVTTGEPMLAQVTVVPTTGSSSEPFIYHCPLKAAPKLGDHLRISITPVT